jgi:hypothetical protein
MYSLDILMDRKTVRNMESVIPKINKFEKLVHLVGITIGILVSNNAGALNI